MSSCATKVFSRRYINESLGFCAESMNRFKPFGKGDITVPGDTTIKATTTRDMSSRTRLPTTPEIVDAIQEFVRIRRQSRQRTVANDVAHF
ncbi:hypothetical protein H257_10743 [Aphanomyces astaci]|nr:hypothetical protein H257_10743 [Aphanomyces astaci]ETV74606.1 hypothetical protein H257_10743 [Aphanomyces astaci]|eukprot:XP_009835693.1 hypothetical protein H257_10743 [Aphanomyces astaci]